MNEVTKRYLYSSIVTFVTGVAVVLLAQIDSITVESFKDGSILGVLFIAVRTGFKLVLEALVGIKS